MEISEVIRHGIITEKSVALQNLRPQQGPNTDRVIPRYTFKVALQANKHQIKQAVEAMFPGVKVKSVNTMRVPGKARVLRTRKGMFRVEAKPWKKAIVTLAEGQTIAELQA
jgi:large subunit ribosomal protein L23